MIRTKYKYIAIEGNIGAGKTTLSNALSSALDSKLLLEAFAENPFLEEFYKNPEKNALAVELFFALQRYRQIISKAEEEGGLLVADFCFDKTLLFARVNLEKLNFWLYKDYFELLQEKIPSPDILIYLKQRTESLLSNIKKRGRNYEQEIKASYLLNLEKQYQKFLKQDHSYPVVVVDMSKFDLINNPREIKYFVELLEQNFERGYHELNL